jgi:VanZ family protein
MSPHKRAGTIITVLALLFIAVLTLWPDPSAGPQPVSACISCGELGGTDLFLNVLLFIPLGFGLRLRGLSRWRAWSIALAVTVGVETLQWRVIVGRDASLGDVLSNSFGAFLGMLLADHGRELIFPAPIRARRLMRVGALGWVAVVALGGWAMRPARIPGPYRAFLAPDLYHIELFEGTVVSASLDGWPLVASATVLRDDSLPRRIRRDTVRLDARVIPAGATYNIAPIVSLSTTREPMALALGQIWHDLTLQVRLNSATLGMRAPMVVLPDALSSRSASPGAVGAPAGGDTIAVSGTIIGGRRLIAEVESEPRARAELALDPFLLWAAVMPMGPFPPRISQTLTMLWIALLVSPLAYWAGRATRDVRARSTFSIRPLRSRVFVFVALTLVLGLAVVPPLFGFPVARASIWLAAAVDALVLFLLGAGLSRASQRALERAGDVV